MADLLLDDFHARDGLSALGTRWRVISDQDQGGFSKPRIGFGEKDGTPALLLHGIIVKMNYGGWIAADLPLSKSGKSFDASEYSEIRIRIRGDGKAYAVRLQSSDTLTSKQYYEAILTAPDKWEEKELPFEFFTAVGTDVALNTSRLTHLLLVGIEEGRVEAEVETLFLR
jgi:hypothetical protein